ncbi:MAG: AzlC family ABC transporter permease [Sphingomonadales bacterium]|nr:AzlC family ABC transporter permease [Sphingomonadales bacterium]
MTDRPALSRAFWRGTRQGLPFLIVVVPFGVLFGVAGTEAGFNFWEVMGFSVLVIAGASQFTAVQLMADHTPAVLVLATSLAVNLRMAMYSASLTPHLGAAPAWKKALVAYFMIDQSFALADADYARRPEQSVAEKLAFYAGACLPTCPTWYVGTMAGVFLGKSIPPAFALDFAVPVTFLAMIAPSLRSVPHLVAAGTSVIGALVFAPLPAGTGVLAAAALAMVAGARTEIWLARRAAA